MLTQAEDGAIVAPPLVKPPPSRELVSLIAAAIAGCLLQVADWAITMVGLSSSPRIHELNPVMAYLFSLNPLVALLPKLAIIGLLMTGAWLARWRDLRDYAWAVVIAGLALGVLIMAHNIDIMLRSAS